jgi:hypothetical protein
MTAFTRSDWRVAPGEHKEGAITEAIEHYTSMAPSGFYLSLAVSCMGLSALLHTMGRRHDALFIGQWVPSILIMGLYNKLVRTQGSD